MEAAVKAYQSVTQKEFRDRLVLEHLGLVRHVLGRVVAGLPSMIDVDNLDSAGVVGLVEAAAQFDPSQGVAFATFAYHRVRGSILDELRRNCPLPQHVLERWNQIKSAWDAMGEHATPAAVAAACQLSEEEVESCFSAIRFTQPTVWEEHLLEHHRATSGEDDPAEQLDANEETRLLADAIERLPSRMRTALTLYYLDDLRMAEIGAVLNLSESRVSRLIAESQLRLKNILDAMREAGTTCKTPIPPPHAAQLKTREGSHR